MAEIKSIYAPQVEADLKKVFSELEKHHKLIIEMSKTSIDLYGGRQAGNPTELKNAIKAYEELAQKQKELEAQLKRLTEAKRQNNTLTSQEIVNGKALKQNADLQATATSKVVGAYARLNAEYRIAERRLLDLKSSQTASNNEIRKAQKEFDVLRAKIMSADQAVGRWNRSGERTIAGLQNLMGAFGIAGGLTFFAQMTMDTVRLIKELQSLNLALQQVSGTEADFTSNLSFIQETSENLGLSVNALTRQFTQFYVSAKDKLARQEIENIFTSIAKAGATMGLSLEQQNRAFLAINQMMSKGTVQAEELRGQLGEALPGAFVIMAKAIGVTEKELGDMLKKGEVLAKDVLPAFARELEKAYGIENITNVKTLTAETNRLSNAWTNFVKEIDSGDGVISKFLTFTIGGIAELIKDVGRLQKAWTFLRPDIAIEKLKKGYREDEKADLQRIGEQIGENQLEQIKGSQAQKNEAKELTRIKLEQSYLLVDEINQLKKRNEFLRNRIPETNIRQAKEFRDEIELNNEKIIKNNNVIITNRGQIKAYNDVLNEKTKTIDKDTKATTKNTTAKKEQTKAVDELLKGTEAWYNQLISDLRKEQSTLADTTAQWQVYKNAIEEVEAQLDNLKTLRPKDLISSLMPTDTDLLLEIGLVESSLNQSNEALVLINKNTELAKKLMAELADQMLNTYGSDFINNNGLTNFFDIAENGLGQFGDNWQAKTVAIMEATQEMFNFIANLSQAHFAQEYDDLARQKEVSIQFAGESTTAREEIEQEYERRRKEIQLREAKAKRSQAIFNIGIDMAQAIMRAWAQNPVTAPVFTAIIGALGVAQIAAVASQPLPQFYKGTDNAPEGFAEVGERGRELIKDGKTGQWRLAEKRSVDFLTKGSTVLTNANTEKVLNFHAFNKGLTNVLNENNIDFYPIESKIEKLTNAILNKESFKMISDSNGQRYYEEKNGQMKSLNNARLTIKQKVF